MSSTFGRHAIVIGSSIAGLCAGRILAEHFEQVTILDRDHLPDRPEPRQGVPQGQHVHILLMRGRAILEQLFPGLDEELAQQGAPTLDWTRDTLWLTPSGWGQRFPSGLIYRPCTRPLLEWTARQHLAAHPQVSFREGFDVMGLLANADGTTVTGVKLRRRGAVAGQSDAEGETLTADLVVDASGRTSRAPEWLTTLGYTRPPETVINSFLGYAGRRYRPTPNAARDWKLLLIAARPPASARGGVIFPTEGGDWIVTVSGAGRDYPPTDEAGWLEFARSLPTPLFFEAIRDAEPLSTIHGYQRTENRWRHYERLARRPERFLALGDAVCAFNPVYGQGMTSAAMGALTLDQCLREQAGHRAHGDLFGLAGRFQKQLARSNQVIWTMATGEDYRYPTTEGPRPAPLMRFMHRYLDEVLLLARQDHNVQVLVTQVLHLVYPPTVLFRPRIMAQVLPRLAGKPVSVPSQQPSMPAAVGIK